MSTWGKHVHHFVKSVCTDVSLQLYTQDNYLGVSTSEQFWDGARPTSNLVFCLCNETLQRTHNHFLEVPKNNSSDGAMSRSSG